MMSMDIQVVVRLCVMKIWNQEVENIKSNDMLSVHIIHISCITSINRYLRMS